MNLQYRVLYREFLFRIVDLEVLASRGDISRLAGQIVALLAAISFTISLSGARLLFSPIRSQAILVSAWQMQHFLISLTMIGVGLFAVLSWDSTFPDRRDVFVLAPLPIRTRTFFQAKVAATATALGLTVLAINAFTGVVVPLISIPLDGGVLAIPRTIAAYWITVSAAGAFLFCALLTLQGVSAQLLPRRLFLRWSAFLQLAAFCLVLAVFFLQPSLATPDGLGAASNQGALQWLPTYWFLGLFHLLNGDLPPVMEALARRAAVGSVAAIAAAALAFFVSYFRTIRRIVEEPDITPAARQSPWNLSFGDPLRTAVVLFTWRTLLRSRQHRVILAGYLGVALAVMLAYGKSLLYGYARDPWWQINVPILVSSVVLLCFAVVGLRVVFTLPLTLRANWIFRLTSIQSPRDYFHATRWALFLIAVAPVLVLTAGALYPIWPAIPVTGHLIQLALLGTILVDVSLKGFRKIPFTCAYLPGKASIHVMSGACVFLLLVITDGAMRDERRTLTDPLRFARFLGFVALLAMWFHYRWRRRANENEPLQFDEAPPSELTSIEFRRDGAWIDGSATD